MAICLAATRPHRTAALILATTSARHLVADDYPIGIPPRSPRRCALAWRRPGGPRSWWACCCQPRRRPALRLLARQAATRHHQPTDPPGLPARLLHRRRPPAAPPGPGTHAGAAPTPVPAGAHRARPLPGRTPSRGQAGGATRDRPAAGLGDPELALDAIQEFLTGVRRAVEPDRMLATVLFTDLVASTQRAAQLGDQRWRELLEVHDQPVGTVVGPGSGLNRLLEELPAAALSLVLLRPAGVRQSSTPVSPSQSASSTSDRGPGVADQPVGGGADLRGRRTASAEPAHFLTRLVTRRCRILPTSCSQGPAPPAMGAVGAWPSAGGLDIPVPTGTREKET
jgi:hypothetical protein